LYVVHEWNSPRAPRWWDSPRVPRPLHLQFKHCSGGLNLDQPSLVWRGSLYCYFSLYHCCDFCCYL